MFPTCKGVLRKAADHSYRCPMGHTFTQQTLIMGPTKVIEAALWVAIRQLEEQDKLLNEIINEQQPADTTLNPWFECSAGQSRAYAGALRHLLASHPLPY